MKVCTHTPTGRLLEAQSGDEKAHLKTLLKNAVSAGYPKHELEAKVVSEAEYRRLLAVQVAADTSYADRRRAAYPPLADQLDRLWHAIHAGTPLDTGSEFYRSIAAVKQRFPKPPTVAPDGES